MAFGNWPVASLRQRTVYKTEFDIFKQNTDIDLISLVSYEDQPVKHFGNESVRPKTVAESNPRFRDIKGLTEKTSDRNKVHSAYRRDYNTNSKYKARDREFKRRTWTKSETSIYKDFAKTSRVFLGKKCKDNYQRNEKSVNRDCKSALEIRQPSAAEETRCQTTCGFHLNERNRTPSKNNTLNYETRDQSVNVKHQLSNKTDKSILKHIWRTRSAPTRAQENKRSPTKVLTPTQKENIPLEESKYGKRSKSGWSEHKREWDLRTKKCRNLKEADQDKESFYNTFSPLTEYVNCVDNELSACRDKDNTVTSERIDRDESRTFECVENECVTCTTENECDNCIVTENIREASSRSVTHLNEDGVCSKDSGFASNAVTPELEFWNKSFVDNCKVEDLNDERLKRVQFNIQNNEENITPKHEDTGSLKSENENSVALSETVSETEENKFDISYDINDLIHDLERIGANSRLSVISTGGHSNYTADVDTDSLCGAVAQKDIIEIRKKEELEKAKLEEEKEELNKPKDIESLIMSKEARHAIIETLHDMGTGKGKKRDRNKDSASILHKGVNATRRQTNNRNKYEYYMKERTKSYYRNHFKSIDSVGNEENSSGNSSPRDEKDCDDTSSEDHIKGKLFPSIRENTRLSKNTNTSTKSDVLTLDQAKKTKYKIPGIGNYHLIASPDNDFEITPAGFDSRYNPRPVITKDEMEIPPRFIRERSIQKCKNWLSNVNMSPMSLRPVKNSK